jgi:hypothetical protein
MYREGQDANTLREHATVRCCKQGETLTTSPSLSSLSSRAHQTWLGLGTSAGSSIIDADLCPLAPLSTVQVVQAL